MVFFSLALNLLSKYLQMSLTGTAIKSKFCMDLYDLTVSVWEQSVKFCTLFDAHLSNILRFCLTGTKSENSLMGNLRDCSHSLIKSGKCDTFFSFTHCEPYNRFWLLLTSWMSKLIFFCLNEIVFSESVDESRRSDVQSVTMPSMSRYLTSSNGVWLKSCPATVVVQWW